MEDEGYLKIALALKLWPLCKGFKLHGLDFRPHWKALGLSEQQHGTLKKHYWYVSTIYRPYGLESLELHAEFMLETFRLALDTVVAFAMGHHMRLGAESQVFLLKELPLMMIVDAVTGRNVVIAKTSELCDEFDQAQFEVTHENMIYNDVE